MRFGRLDVGLGRSAPHGDQATGAARLLEVADVVAQLLGEIHLGLALLHVGAVDLLHVVVIEDGGARLDRGEERLQLLEQAVVEHAGVRGGFVHVVFEDVPAGEDQVVEPGERNEFLHLGRAAVGALAEADGAHLRERSDGLGEAFADRFDAGDEGRGHRAHARDHDAELAFGGLDGAVFRLRCGSFCATGSGRQFHLAAGALGVSQSGLAMLMLSRCCGCCELLAMAAAVGIPPVGHEDSWAFLIHVASLLVTVAGHRHRDLNHLTFGGSLANDDGQTREIAPKMVARAVSGNRMSCDTSSRLRHSRQPRHCLHIFRSADAQLLPYRGARESPR